MTRPRFAPLLAKLAAVAALPALGACAAQGGMDGEPDIRAPLAVATGEPQSCLPLGNVRRQIVHDDYTIDFKVGKQLFRNTLPHRCPRLGFEKAIVMETYDGRICSPQIFYVMQDYGRGIERGPACALGEFVPIELADEDTRPGGDAPAIMQD